MKNYLMCFCIIIGFVVEHSLTLLEDSSSIYYEQITAVQPIPHCECLLWSDITAEPILSGSVTVQTTPGYTFIYQGSK